MKALNRKITEAVERLELDLSNKVVLTEAASGPYAVTAIIAALAGAHTYAFTRTTRYGTVQDIREQTNALWAEFGSTQKGSIEIIENLTPEIISRADIITNSGHLRPLDEPMLRHAKKSVVIPLMYEAWERRETDLDIKFCRQAGIRTGATNERHPAVDVFGYLGDMALKLIFDAGLSAYRNTFVLICNNDFGYHIANVISKVCTKLGVCDLAENRDRYKDLDITWLGDFPDFDSNDFSNADAILFTAVPFDEIWIGKTGVPITIGMLRSAFNEPYVLRYAGDINEEECKGEIQYFPGTVSRGHMGVLPSAIGYDPIIRLQSGGLKAGELMMKNETTYQGVMLCEMI